MNTKQDVKEHRIRPVLTGYGLGGLTLEAKGLDPDEGIPDDEVADIPYEKWSTYGDLNVSFRGKDEMQTSSVSVDDNWRRLGIAGAMYRYAMALTGRTFAPGDEQTPDGYAFWEVSSSWLTRPPRPVEVYRLMDARGRGPYQESATWSIGGGELPEDAFTDVEQKCIEGERMVYAFRTLDHLKGWFGRSLQSLMGAGYLPRRFLAHGFIEDRMDEQIAAKPVNRAALLSAEIVMKAKRTKRVPVPRFKDPGYKDEFERWIGKMRSYSPAERRKTYDILLPRMPDGEEDWRLKAVIYVMKTMGELP